MLAAGASLILLALVVSGAAPVAAGLAVLAAAVAAVGLSLGRRGTAATPDSVEAQAAVQPGFPLSAPVIDGLPDPMLVVAAREPDDFTDRRIVFANAAARELLRIQTGPGLLVTAVRDPAVLEAADEALFGEVESAATLEVGGAQPRQFKVLARPLGRDQDGRGQALLVFREETEQRRVERTRADFLANASHELRTPLASLSGFIETLRGHARDDVVARDRFLGVMQAQAQRMSRLIDDLMSLSRIELNEHLPPQEAVDLGRAVHDVVDGLGPLARERGVRLEVIPAEPGPISVTGDRDQIIQVVQNLVDNGLKYSPPGGSVSITLEQGLPADAVGGSGSGATPRLPLLTPDHGHGRYASVRVGDSGPGIAREHLPRLTERFYRVEGQKSGERAGTGLGLAIVKHIMNRHRGGLVVESRAGAGTAFTAYFPEAVEPGTGAVMKLS